MRTTPREVESFCPLAGPAKDDAEVLEALTAAVFSARFRPRVVAARWPAIRDAFAGFDLARVASWPDSEVERLLAAPGMIRNRKKILATLRNARDLAHLARAHGGARAYLDALGPDPERAVAALDAWAHYVGAPSLRAFLRCARADPRARPR